MEIKKYRKEIVTDYTGIKYCFTDAAHKETNLGEVNNFLYAFGGKAYKIFDDDENAYVMQADGQTFALDAYTPTYVLIDMKTHYINLLKDLGNIKEVK